MKIPIYKRIWFKLALTVVVGLSLAFYASYYFTTKYSKDIVVSNTQKEFNTAMKVINNFIRVVGETSQVWAKHTVIDNHLDRLVLEADAQALRKQLLIDKSAVSADTILLLDKEATIVGNVGSVQMIGNTLKRNALVKKSFNTQSAQTMIMRENESFIIYSSSPVFSDKTMVGLLLVGYFINDAFLETIKKNIDLDIAFVGNSAIMSSTLWAGQKTLDILPIEYIRYQELLKQEGKLTYIEHNNQEFIISAKNLDHIDPAISGSILVGIPSESYENIHAEIFNTSALFFSVLFMVSLVVVLLITRKSTNAVLQLNEATTRISKGDFEVQLDVKGGDEINMLANNFSQMVEHIKIKDAIIQKHTSTLESKVASRTTQLKEANEKLALQNDQLEASNKSFEELINATIEAILVLRQGKIIDLNTSALQLLGFEKKSEALGLLIDDFISQKSESIIKEHIEESVTDTYEIVLMNRKQEEFFALIKEQNVTRVGESVRMMTIVDLTELKNKDKLISSQAKMSAMGEMIENIAHQWRQPLSVITTSASSISAYKRFGKLNDEILENAVNNIVKTSKYLSSTIDDFRNFFRSDKEKERFNLAGVIQSNLNLVEASLKQENIKVHANLDETLDFLGYRNELLQAIINIVNNAKDAMKNIENSEDKHLFIDLESKKKHILIKFTDSGGGINDKIIDKIFEPYFTTKHQSHGTGLGLYMTHQIIVLNMDGKLNVKNVQYELNKKRVKGAEFVITLPNR